MFVDPHRTSQPTAFGDPAPTRIENAGLRPHAPAPPGVRFPLPRPALASVQNATDDVRVQWDGDNGVVIKFTEKKSGAIVRQIPSEQVLSVANFIRQLLQAEQVSDNGSAGKTVQAPSATASVATVGASLARP